MQKVNRNERILNENLQLNKMVDDEINRMRTQLDSVFMLNKNIQQIQRELTECQHTFEILVDEFLHAQDTPSCACKNATTVDYYNQD